ncbi:hypothetical protein JJB09_25580 [Rhizobium sp. KVB221]|uniref:Uncharacterized protein n=1 Tax=Rhizobium setariae TaxID=2801340 RepID=A0A936YWR7_9HYPH|nr:hypothetical protein [Rhizobium setariae]MBL0375387.1 hypothetical protein [Rhizobium setariae]
MKALQSQTRHIHELVEATPIAEMIRDLDNGSLPPVAKKQYLEERYRSLAGPGYDLEACMSHACAAQADKSGAVLIIMDRDGKRVFGQVNDPGCAFNDSRMQMAFRSLVKSIPARHSVAAAKRSARDGTPTRSIEYPIVVMPEFNYVGERCAAAVQRYGRYLTSYRVPVQPAALTTEPARSALR